MASVWRPTSNEFVLWNAASFPRFSKKVWLYVFGMLCIVQLRKTSMDFPAQELRWFRVNARLYCHRCRCHAFQAVSRYVQRLLEVANVWRKKYHQHREKVCTMEKHMRSNCNLHEIDEPKHLSEMQVMKKWPSFFSLSFDSFTNWMGIFSSIYAIAFESSMHRVSVLWTVDIFKNCSTAQKQYK